MRRIDDRDFEWQMLEGVQSIVVNENADGALPGKQMRGVFHCAEQSVQTALLRLIGVRHQGVPVRDLGSSLATFLSIFTVVLS